MLQYTRCASAGWAYAIGSADKPSSDSLSWRTYDWSYGYWRLEPTMTLTESTRRLQTATTAVPPAGASDGSITPRGSAYTTVGMGYCSSTDGPEFAQKQVTGGTESEEQVEEKCTKDSRCVAFAYKSPGHYVLYSDTPANCDKFCDKRSWQIDNELITRGYCPTNAANATKYPLCDADTTAGAGDGGAGAPPSTGTTGTASTADEIGAAAGAAANRPGIKCKRRPKGVLATTGTSVAGAGSTQLAGLDADPDPTFRDTSFATSMKALKASDLFNTVTAKEKKSLKSRNDKVKWLGYTSAIFFSLVLVLVLGLLFLPSRELVPVDKAKAIAFASSALGK